jgi:ABC-type uncharacterized transport system ATPase subunit
MKATLQLIMEQLKELKTDMCAIDTGQEVLKSDITTTTAELKRHIFAELKSDMNKIRADLITQVRDMENKMGNYMSVVREELETNIGVLCAGQAELEERLDKHQKNVTSIVEKQARNLREVFEDTRRELEAELARVEARNRRAGPAVLRPNPLQ